MDGQGQRGKRDRRGCPKQSRERFRLEHIPHDCKGRNDYSAYQKTNNYFVEQGVKCASERTYAPAEMDVNAMRGLS